MTTILISEAFSEPELKDFLHPKVLTPYSQNPYSKKEILCHNNTIGIDTSIFNYKFDKCTNCNKLIQ